MPLSLFIQVARTKYHKLVNSRNVFLTVLETEKAKIRCQLIQYPVRVWFLVGAYRWCLLAVLT